MNLLTEYIWLLFLAITIVIVFYQLFKRPKPSPSRAIKEGLGKQEETVPLSRVNEIVEQERQRIASDLHDELGTLLSVIHLDLELVLREASQLTPHGEARLIEIRKNLNLVIESIRHNIWSLAPQMLDQVTLSFALRELCHKLDAYKGTHLHFVQSGSALALTQKQKLNLFRIVQELLTNAIKHSGAWNISVYLHWEADYLNIIVEDDGSGYTRAAYEQQTEGMGTNNIIKRADIIGATIKKEDLARGLRVTIALKNLKPGSNGSDIEKDRPAVPASA